MKRYLALLRGINVGGIRVPMPALKVCFEGLGYQNVKTYLQTGNVVFEAQGSLAAMKPVIEAELSRTFAYQAYVLLYEFETLVGVAAGYPFPREEGFHAYVVFVSDPLILEELKGVATATDEPTAPGLGVIYWKVRRGESLTTGLSKVLAKAKYKATTTIRNLNTLEKMLEDA